jgi:hypothetical protein
VRQETGFRRQETGKIVNILIYNKEKIFLKGFTQNLSMSYEVFG